MSEQKNECQCTKPVPLVERLVVGVQYRCTQCDQLIVVKVDPARAAMFRNGQAR